MLEEFMTNLRNTGSIFSPSIFVSWLALAATSILAQTPNFEALYTASCSACHGATLEGTPTGPALVGVPLRHGDTLEGLAASTANGFAQSGMPAMRDTLDAAQIRGMAIFVSEQRAQLSYTDFKVQMPLVIPASVQHTSLHNYRIETVATGIDPFPFSIAPLPDGSILVTEKTKGLRIVSADGTISPLIEGTPTVYDDSFQMPGLLFIIGTGWLLDVAIDPDYENNSWVYLHYGDRCSGCNEMSRSTNLPVTMNTISRGRIRDGKWVDEEILWKVPVEQYTWMTDQAAGGRLAFDDKGHLFFSIGMKGTGNFAGIQDLKSPVGKIHRINQDGTIPADNPYLEDPDALDTIWSLGHRSPQGLEYDSATGQLWGTEMGPRGGDEVNLLQPGKNYGWPLVSKGLNYDGTPVSYGAQLGIDPDSVAIEQPVVDLTPAPAVSSFIIYDGEQFPAWRKQFLVGSLKATELYRMKIENGTLVERETLLSGLGRIRDIEAAPDGSILLLIEHLDGGHILRLVRN
jgi:glucose/arabinose dehydrogenase